VTRPPLAVPRPVPRKEVAMGEVVVRLRVGWVSKYIVLWGTGVACGEDRAPGVDWQGGDASAVMQAAVL
jgi:hypothetical protein